MKILVTGATGYIGSAVAQALYDAGHEVHGLSHDDTAADTIRRNGWTPAEGDLREVDGLERLATGFEAIVHAANSGGPDAGAVDEGATRALLRGLSRRGGVFVYTSGAWVLGPGRSDELATPRPAELVAWRAALEREVLRAGGGVKGMVVRPGIVYGRGGGIPGMLARGDLPVIAPGTQRWPLVHVDDLAQLYVRALAAPAGSVLHGITVTMTMAELGLLAAAGRTASEYITLEEARQRFGVFADALALDQDVSAGATRAALDWQPAGPSPVMEFLAGSYTRRAA
jgi:nucleoside-diphosphate-sugar epimerase